MPARPRGGRPPKQAPSPADVPEQLGPRSRKGRGPAADTIALGLEARRILAAAPSAMTLRQLYYALVSAGAIPKTEAAYAKLKRVVRDRREDGAIPWAWIVDHTRSVFQARAWAGPEEVLRSAARHYRRQLMTEQRVALQLWAESDSIGSVVAQIADQYTVPTFIGRGYAARGYLWQAASDAVVAHQAGKDVVILHVGDFDPSGEDIFRDVEVTLRLYAATRLLQLDDAEAEWTAALARKWANPEALTYWLEVRRLALTPEQVEAYDLPVRPVKASDSRTARFGGEGAVEVEALPVDALLRLVEDAITSCIDVRAMRVVRVAEQSEREILRRIAATPVARLAEVAS